MRPSLLKLIEISKGPLGPEAPRNLDPSVPKELAELLILKNGFLAFGSALHVFSIDSSSRQDLSPWNHPDGWRRYYDLDLSPSSLAFAEDLFANQYLLSPDGVFKLNAETAELERKGHSLDDWAQTILCDYSYETGYPLAAEWQKRNYPLRPGFRLLPRKPFVLGGDYSIENLIEVEVVLAMEKLGQLSSELASIPDGTEVELNGWLKLDH